MLVAIIILSWLLVSTWITLIIVGRDDGLQRDEWAGIIVACLCGPAYIFIIHAIKRSKEKKHQPKIYWVKYED